MKKTRNLTTVLIRRIDRCFGGGPLTDAIGELGEVLRRAMEADPGNARLIGYGQDIAGALLRLQHRVADMRASLLVEPLPTEAGQLHLDLAEAAGPPPPVNGNGGWAALQN